MIPRRHIAAVRRDLARFPAVVLLGPRGIGKTTLARRIAAEDPRALYLDLEDPSDEARLADASSYLGRHRRRLVVLDEVQRLPGLFRALRGQIDARRWDGVRSGHFLLLASASGASLGQTGESLAGRSVWRSLPGLDPLEAEARLDRLWVRGGFPESFAAATEALSLEWRRDFVRGCLERDLPLAGLASSAVMLRRLWTMLCHRQGAPIKSARLASILGMAVRTVNRSVDAMVDLMLARRLQPYWADVGKRLIKSPKLYVRDSGVVHALLGIGDLDELLGHPAAGPSWEGFVVENLCGAAPMGTDAFFYRTRAGAEIDLLLLFPGGDLWAVEAKLSTSPRVPRGLRIAAADVAATRVFVVHPGEETWSLGGGVTAIPLPALMRRLIEAGAA